jgi:hypothetical protein
MEVVPVLQVKLLITVHKARYAGPKETGRPATSKQVLMPIFVVIKNSLLATWSFIVVMSIIEITHQSKPVYSCT